MPEEKYYGLRMFVLRRDLDTDSKNRPATDQQWHQAKGKLKGQSEIIIQRRVKRLLETTGMEERNRS